MSKKRLDVAIQELYPQYSRMHIQSWIMQGKVTVDGVIVTKAGPAVKDDAVCILNAQEPKYVSRAGFKLERALEHFSIDVHTLVALDAGLSTGGFTDCLLQNGIAKVYGIDVSYGQVQEKIRTDTRVVVMERTNVRHLAPLHEKVDLITLDLSFISVLKVIPSVCRWLSPGGEVVALIKPQFEAAREDVGSGGVIINPEVHQGVVERIKDFLPSVGLEHRGIIESPILGGEGNKEFLLWAWKIPA